MDQLVRRQAADRSGGLPTGLPAALPAAPAVGRSAGRSAQRASEAPRAACPVQVVAEALGRPGRRRGRELEAAIFEAALDQLTSGGFARLTMEGVAGAARTGKAALYRRWASKVELVIDALDSTLPRPTDTPALGSARAELHYLVESFVSVASSRAGGAVSALMAELDHDQAELFKDFIAQRMLEPTKAVILAILRRGAERGDVRPGAATPLIADVVPAMLLYRVKVCGCRIGPEFVDQLVDEVLVPLIRP
ncbi:TetR/AcrR family transcriptional regulator [Kitasatospora sp. NPDC057541]|uniref:TetR/AcrR family transcriptional regulator n=1 Tax=unclassified Kitasatospora TaxID=2633591 RepID=UPI003685701F